MKKTPHHRRFGTSCVEARKALSAASKLVDTRREPDGAPLAPEDLRLKAASAMTWLSKTQELLTQARVQLEKELEYRTVEADPDTIRRREIEADVKRLTRERQRLTGDALREAVLKMRNESGMLPAAIADALKVSDFRVKQILRDARAA